MLRNFFIDRVQLHYKISFRITNETSLNNLYQGLVSENFSVAVDLNDIDKSMKLIHDKILLNYNLHCLVQIYQNIPYF